MAKFDLKGMLSERSAQEIEIALLCGIFIGLNVGA